MNNWDETTPLNIGILQKDQAKEIADPQGKSIIWNPEKKEWFWPGPKNSVPQPLQHFLFQGNGEIKDFVLKADNKIFSSIKNNPPESGRIRWEESLQRGIWRGKFLPKTLEEFQPDPASFESLASILLNRNELKRKKSFPESIITPILPQEEHILLGKGTPNKNTLFSLEFENAFWLLPWRNTTKLKTPFQNKLPPIVIQGVPSFSQQSQKASQLMGLLKFPPKLYFIPPQKNTDPTKTFIYLPLWSKKYHKRLTNKDFTKILKAFQIKTEGPHLNSLWIPSQKDAIYFQTLFQS